MTDLRAAAEMALEALEAINEMSKPPMGIPLPAEIDGAMDALRTALAQPEQEPTVPDNMQDWANLDGDIAWHLIDRHADNWADIKKMMDEFVAAKIASAQSKHECETCANKRKRLEQSGFLKSPLRGEE